MSTGITFSGLGSGLDSDAIIKQLVDIERRPIVMMQNQQLELEGRKSAVQTINSSLLSLKESVAQLQKDELFSVVQALSSAPDRIGVSADNKAAAGGFTVEVHNLAEARRLSSRSLGAVSAPLHISGEFVINGQGVRLEESDTLLDLRDRINAANAGVSAQVLSVNASDNRLILSADKVGAQGFDLKDASTANVLQALGFLSSNTTIKNAFENGARSDGFLAADETIGSLVGLMSPPAGTITVGNRQIAVDLAADTLESVRDKINAAASAGVQATISSDALDGLTRYHLDVQGTTTFIDDGGILEALGIFSDGTLATPMVTGVESDRYASTATAVGLLLGLGNAPAGSVRIGGAEIDIDLASDTLTDIQTRINDVDLHGVVATVVRDTDAEGKAQFRLRIDGTRELEDSNNVLQTLGVLAGTNNTFAAVHQVLTGNVANQQVGTLVNPVEGGARTATFASDQDSIGAMTGTVNSGMVSIGGAWIALDLETDSLESMRDKINAAAPAGVTATINELDGGYELQIDGTTDLVEDGGVLETLGLLSAPVAMTAETRFSEIVGAGVQAGDTISIQGTNHAGDQVAATFTISSPNLRLQNLLSAIEQTFGGQVSASVDSHGRVVVVDEQAGQSGLTANLRVNNEGDGSLDLGTMSVTRRGTNARSSQLQAGRDAQIAINGIMLSRDSNTISDAVQGVTLDLQQAEPGHLVNVTVTRDDTRELRQRIQAFVADYNKAMDLINEQFVYVEEKKSAGPLSGDVTLLTLQSQLRAVMTGEIAGLDDEYNALVLVGLSFDRHGRLGVNEERLDQALAENLSAVKKIFVAQGTTADDGITFLSSSSRTQAGAYAVEITRAATRGFLMGSEEFTGALAEDRTLTLRDRATNQTVIVELEAGASLETIVGQINAATSSDIAAVRRSSLANTTDGSTPVTASTTFAGIFGAESKAGDTIRINGTTHDGTSVSRTFRIEAPDTTTIGDLLDEIRRAFGGRVSASIDAEGRLLVSDNQLGTSQLSVTLIEGNEGGGSVSFGSLASEVSGRYGVELRASREGDRLVLEHSGYGSAHGFTVLESPPALGLAAGDYLGVDVAGTINGEPAEGLGRILTGASGNETTDGLSVRVALEQHQLDQTGTDRGMVKLTYGVARQLHDTLQSITDHYDGTLKNRTDALDSTIRNLDNRIADTERRVEQYRISLVRRFSALEGAIAAMQSQANFLSAQLAGLMNNSG